MAIDEFNSLQRKFVRALKWEVADESMSAWSPRTTALGGLPNISFVVQKPEPLGTEFCCLPSYWSDDHNGDPERQRRNEGEKA
jgi:hypothetical protein